MIQQGSKSKLQKESSPAEEGIPGTLVAFKYFVELGE